MKPLVFSPKARSDLLEIADYIAEGNPLRAESFVAELEAKAEIAAKRPLSFPERPELSPGLRSAVHGRYLILFRNLPDHVRSVRELHGSRDLGRVFGDQTH